MRQAAKWLSRYFLPAIAIGFFLQACTNDLSKVKELSKAELINPVDSSTGVTVTYSDSAKVKATLETPLMLDFSATKTPHREMPKGVKITFYDKNIKITGTVTADYAITSNNENLVTFKKNVVLRNATGDTFKSEEMIWDKLQKLLYTNQRWQWTKVDGTDLNGTKFTTNEKFTPWTGTGANGIIETHGALGH